MQEKKPEGKQMYTNRLAQEKSPYLLQHAHNPVDWYPWGEEAFLAAKERDLPIFLSVGYATCHWCHVMEKESFEDPQIAKMMNEAFINIKVDREELPDVDSLYMEFAQGMMSGSAGWPLNMVLTAELHPIFAATYLPPKSRQGMMGLADLVQHIKEVWKGDEREKLIEQADRIIEVFRENMEYEKGEIPKKEEIENTAEIFYKIADPVYGGLKGAPKFPLAYQSSFLLRYSKLKQDGRALFLVERGLEMMHRGGIWDHLGGGFARYSVDDKWHIPHFEKMLYDNALLVSAYIEGYVAEKAIEYKEVVEGILDYVLEEMQGPDGGFYSAQDADSEGQEGLYYTWTAEEVQKLIDPDWADLVCLYFDVSIMGNFEGRNVLFTQDSLEEFCQKYAVDQTEFKSHVDRAKESMLKVRKSRVPPFKDDKVLSSWNGLMIHALAEAGAALSNERYIEAARKGANFVLSNMWHEENLLHRWREGEANFAGNLDDYAFMTKALITLFEVTADLSYLEWALNFTEIVSSRFSHEEGGFYQTAGAQSHLIVRKVQFADGAEPSGNAIQAENLLRLYQLTRHTPFLEQAEGIFRAVGRQLGGYSPGYCYHVMNLLRYYDKKAPTLAIALGGEEGAKERLIREIWSHYLPHKALLIFDKEDEKIARLIPYLKELVPQEGKTTLYLCQQNMCKQPIAGLEAIIEEIRNL